MPFTDHIAASRLRHLREERGLSQEGLATAITAHAQREGWLRPDGIGAVTADTIRRIERHGHGPSERVRLAIALFFTVRPDAIWDPVNRTEYRRGRLDPDQIATISDLTTAAMRTATDPAALRRQRERVAIQLAGAWQVTAGAIRYHQRRVVAPTQEAAT